MEHIMITVTDSIIRDTVLLRVADAAASDLYRRNQCMQMARRMRESGERLYCRVYIGMARVASATYVQRVKFIRARILGGFSWV